MQEFEIEEKRLKIASVLMGFSLVMKVINKNVLSNLLLIASGSIAQNIPDNTANESGKNSVGNSFTEDQNTQTNENYGDQRIMNNLCGVPIVVYVFSFCNLNLFPLFRKRINSTKDVRNIFCIQQLFNLLFFSILLLLCFLIFHIIK